MTPIPRGGGASLPATATTLEMQAGTEAALRMMSPALVAAAIAALGSGATRFALPSWTYEAGGSATPAAQKFTSDTALMASTTTLTFDIASNYFGHWFFDLKVPAKMSLIRATGTGHIFKVTSAVLVGGTMVLTVEAKNYDAGNWTAGTLYQIGLAPSN